MQKIYLCFAVNSATLKKHELCIKKTYGGTVQHVFQYCIYTKVEILSNY
jgi:hypothetical protein